MSLICVGITKKKNWINILLHDFTAFFFGFLPHMILLFACITNYCMSCIAIAIAQYTVEDFLEDIQFFIVFLTINLFIYFSNKIILKIFPNVNSILYFPNVTNNINISKKIEKKLIAVLYNFPLSLIVVLLCFGGISYINGYLNEPIREEDFIPFIDRPAVPNLSDDPSNHSTVIFKPRKATIPVIFRMIPPEAVEYCPVGELRDVVLPYFDIDVAEAERMRSENQIVYNKNYLRANKIARTVTRYDSITTGFGPNTPEFTFKNIANPRYYYVYSDNYNTAFRSVERLSNNLSVNLSTLSEAVGDRSNTACPLRDKLMDNLDNFNKNSIDRKFYLFVGVNTDSVANLHLPEFKKVSEIGDDFFCTNRPEKLFLFEFTSTPVNPNFTAWITNQRLIARMTPLTDLLSCCLRMFESVDGDRIYNIRTILLGNKNQALSQAFEEHLPYMSSYTLQSLEDSLNKHLTLASLENEKKAALAARDAAREAAYINAKDPAVIQESIAAREIDNVKDRVEARAAAAREAARAAEADARAEESYNKFMQVIAELNNNNYRPPRQYSNLWVRNNGILPRNSFPLNFCENAINRHVYLVTRTSNP